MYLKEQCIIGRWCNSLSFGWISSMNKVGVVLFDGCWGSQLMTILDFMTIYQRLANNRVLINSVDYQLYALNQIGVTLANGMRVETQPLTETTTHELLVLVGIEYGHLQQVLNSKQLQNSVLATVLRQSKRVLTLSTASFLIAELTLWPTHPLVTHWQFEGIFRQRYPHYSLKSEVEFVDNGQLCSATGISGALYCLSQYLLRFGQKNLVERCLTIMSKSLDSTEHLWLSESFAYKQHAYTQILAIQHFIDRHYPDNLCLAFLANKFHLSESTLKRHFKLATTLSISDYYQLIRIARMKYLLVNTTLTIEQICQEIGYADSRFARRLFVKMTGQSAKAFRQNLNNQL